MLPWMMCIREFQRVARTAAQEEEGGGGGSSTVPQEKGLENTVVWTFSVRVEVKGRAPRCEWCAAIFVIVGTLWRKGR